MAEKIAESRKTNGGSDTSESAEVQRIPARKYTSQAHTSEKPKPKMSLIVGALLMFVFIVLDVIDIIIKLAGTDDWGIVDAVSYVFLIPYFLYYRYIKNADFSGHMTLMSLIEIIPYVGTLPLRSVGLGITLWIDRHPKGALAKGAHLTNKIMPARIASLKKQGKLPARRKESRSARIMKDSDKIAKNSYVKIKDQTLSEEERVLIEEAKKKGIQVARKGLGKTAKSTTKGLARLAGRALKK